MVQKMVIVQTYNRNEKRNTFLLDGLLFCYECHHKIGVRGKKNGHYYMVCNNYRRNSKLNLCTSHGFSYENLEETVLSYMKNLFTKIDSDKIELSIRKNRTKYDYEKMLKKLETEAKLINDNIDQMYVDKLNGKITEVMYERLYKKLIDEAKQKEKEYIEIQEMQNSSKQDDTQNIKKIVHEFLELKEPTPEVMKVIINRIEIHQDKQVDLYFNFKQLNNIKQNCLLWHQPEAIAMSDKIIVLTHRPAKIKAVHEIDFEIKNRTPLNCRQSPKFSKYFDMMWSELNEKETKEKNNKI